MKNIIFFVILYLGWILSPSSIFALGSKDRCDLTIENNTRAQITQIIIEEFESGKEPRIFNRNVENNTSTIIQIKKNILYGIILVDTNGRQYAKRRQAWNDGTAYILFEFKDILDRNIWDNIRRVIFWPDYL